MVFVVAGAGVLEMFDGGAITSYRSELRCDACVLRFRLCFNIKRVDFNRGISFVFCCFLLLSVVRDSGRIRRVVFG